MPAALKPSSNRTTGNSDGPGNHRARTEAAPTQTLTVPSAPRSSPQVPKPRVSATDGIRSIIVAVVVGRLPRAFRKLLFGARVRFELPSWDFLSAMASS